MESAPQGAYGEKRQQHADKSDNRQVSCLSTSPSRDQAVMDEQQINKPGYEREQYLDVAYPGNAGKRLCPERAGYDTQSNERKSDRQRLVRQIVANFERRKAVMEYRRMFRFQLAFLQKVHHRRDKGDKQSSKSEEDE